MMVGENKMVVFHVVDDEELPPITINYNDELNPVVYLNMHHRLWLALARNVIPGIAVNIQDKLTMICDNYIRDQISMGGLA